MEQKSIAQLSAQLERTFLSELRAVNDRTARFGLTLTEGEQLSLAKKRSNALLETGRVEFGESAVPRILEAFCDSPYLMQDEYSAVAEELIDAFYLLKNACHGLLTDDELLGAMRAAYDASGGTLDAVTDLSVDALCGCRPLDEVIEDV